MRLDQSKILLSGNGLNSEEHEKRKVTQQQNLYMQAVSDKTGLTCTWLVPCQIRPGRHIPANVCIKHWRKEQLAIILSIDFQTKGNPIIEIMIINFHDLSDGN